MADVGLGDLSRHCAVIQSLFLKEKLTNKKAQVFVVSKPVHLLSHNGLINVTKIMRRAWTRHFHERNLSNT